MQVLVVSFAVQLELGLFFLPIYSGKIAAENSMGAELKALIRGVR